MKSGYRLCIAVGITLLSAGVMVSQLVPRIDMSANYFDVRYFTYLDGYDVHIEADRGGRTHQLEAGEVSRQFFREDITAFRLIFTRRPAVDGDAMVMTSSTTWQWLGQAPAPAGLSYVGLHLSGGVEPTQLMVRANHLPAEFSHQQDGLAYYRVPGSPQLLHQLDVRTRTPLANPVRRVLVLEEPPQRIYLDTLQLFRDISQVEFRYPMQRLDAGRILQDFTVLEGAAAAVPYRQYLEIQPTSPRIVLEYSGDLPQFLAEGRAHARPVVWGLHAAIAGFLLLLCWLLYWLISPGVVVRVQAALQNRQTFRATIARLKTLPDRPVGDVRSLRQIPAGMVFLVCCIAALIAMNSVAHGSLMYYLAVAVAAAAGTGLVHDSRSRKDPQGLLPLGDPAAGVSGPITCTSRRCGWVLFSLLVLCTAAAHLYRLGDGYMWIDEAYSFLPARFILETGEPVYPQTGYAYYRAHSYHRLVARSMGWFGQTTWAARLPNVLANLGTLGVIYLFGRKLHAAVGLGAAAIWATSSYVLALTRWVRMYPLQWFLFALAAYLFYLAVVDMPRPRIRQRWRWFDLSFSPVPLVAFFPVFLLALETHRVSVYLVFGLLLFFLADAAANADRRPRSLLGAAVVVLLLTVAGYREQGTLNLFSAFFGHGPSHTRASTPRLSNVTDVVREAQLFWFLFPVTIALMFRKQETWLRFTAALAIGGVLFIGNQYAQNFRYWSAVLPFMALAVSGTLYRLVLAARQLKPVLALVVLLLMLPAAVHLQLFARELGESTVPYDDNAILAHSKADYGYLMQYLQLFAVDRTIMAEHHLSYSLPAHGQRVDVVFREGVSSQDYQPIQRLGIPYFYSDDFVQQRDPNGFLVLRRDEPDITDQARQEFWQHPLAPGETILLVPRWQPEVQGVYH
ncbi:glycosyltransferase family 39 protein [Spirochaeta africana]|uniref:Uncharacterized protein n=1 Tax=Spirochaeta africana (strain ATCC 700263 / DSM 8902 / Z-7692) TaxID=889378 RepID=H9UF45_SPIAZ|nr:glycosyltransferase family 39 protein [Spirochaeta africana]AFG36138.1 hypothetical protein Spiaf_0029 [Spirochaeta africana DSM 8902]